MTPRQHLRTIFDEDALLYNQARPGYPEALFDDIVALAGLPSDARLLEIGPGTGQATLPFAQRGYRIHAVELGANLAAVARRNLAAYSQVQIEVGAFEEAQVEQAAYDLVYSATAFHWLDPTVRYRKAAQVLKPGGSIALFWNKHVHTDADDGFFARVQECYDHVRPIGEEQFPGLPRPEELPEDERGQIEASRFFGPVTVRRYVWHQEYTAESFIHVLSTYSDHRAMEPARRSQLFNNITALINDAFGGTIVKGYTTILFLAPRLAG